MEFNICDKVVFTKNKHWGSWADKYINRVGKIIDIYKENPNTEFFVIKFEDGNIIDTFEDEITHIDNLHKPQNSSINEVYPDKGESKEDFISRFMSITKDEYPDIKQRFAIANSYWDRRNKKKNESIETTVYRGESDNNLSKRFNKVDSGLFYSPDKHGAKGWGTINSYKIKDKNKIFDSQTSSDNFCSLNNLYDKEYSEISSIVKQFTDTLEIKKLRDFTELNREQQNELNDAVVRTVGSNFCWYDVWDWCSQAVAKNELEKQGYGGVKWYNQDFGNPTQYQIWDTNIIESIGRL